MPDIDLTPYQAYASGVSRLHAVVKRDANRVLVMDFGSSNGTYFNGRRLNPHVEESINHGDIVALGKLKIQVLAAQYLTPFVERHWIMAYSVILHISGEASIMGEIEELPKAHRYDYYRQ